MVDAMRVPPAQLQHPPVLDPERGAFPPDRARLRRMAVGETEAGFRSVFRLGSLRCQKSLLKVQEKYLSSSFVVNVGIFRTLRRADRGTERMETMSEDAEFKAPFRRRWVRRNLPRGFVSRYRP